MTKLEKVILALECCGSIMNCEECPYNDKPVGCFTRLKSDALKLLKERQWVSVKDRLPEENKAVNIVWVNHNPPSYYQHIKDKPFVATGVYYDGNWYWWSDVIEDVIAEYGGRVDIAGMIGPDIEITHWQSLPEPPKENEEDDE